MTDDKSKENANTGPKDTDIEDFKIISRRKSEDRKVTKYSGLTEERAKQIALAVRELGADVTYWARQTDGLRIDVADETVAPKVLEYIESLPEAVHCKTGITYEEGIVRRAAPEIADALYEGSLEERGVNRSAEEAGDRSF